MAHNYSSTNYNKEHMAKACGVALPISTKASIEICNSLRKKPLAKAKVLLQGAINLEKAIPYTRFTNGAGHKKGIGAGKYPQKAATFILGVLENAEANAQFKGLNTSNLQITHISAHNAGNVWRYGRHRRRKMKRTHIELIVEEGKKIEKKSVDKKKPTVEKKETPAQHIEKKTVEKAKTPQKVAEKKVEHVKKQTKPAVTPKETTVQPKKQNVQPQKTKTEQPEKKVPEQKEGEKK